MGAIDRRLWAWLFLSIWPFPAVEPSLAKDSASRDVRSARPTEDPIQLIEERGAGVTFPVEVITEVFGNLSGGTTQTAVWESLFIAGIGVDFEKAADLPGLSLAVSGLYAAGTSLTDKAVHDLGDLSNIDAYDSARLYEAWLQAEFWEAKFSIRIGQILADAEFFVSDFGALFINSSFGAIPVVSQNLFAPIFPVAAPGLRLWASPSPSFYAAAAFSGDAGDPATNNKHNTRVSFSGDDGALVLFELGYRFNPPADEMLDGVESPGLTGIYKIGGFFDSGRFDDGPESKRGRSGIYFVGEQELWQAAANADRTLAVFGRLGIGTPDRNLVPLSFDAGFNFHGCFPGRAGDTLGLGFSYTRISDHFSAEGGDEQVVELTYRCLLRNHIFLQPDLQCIIHPGAKESAATAVVVGLRLSIIY